MAPHTESRYGKKLIAWVAHVNAAQQEMNAVVSLLTHDGVTAEPEQTRLVNALPYLAVFSFPDTDSVVRIWFYLKDWQTYSDIVITNITTLPENGRGKGYGSIAVQKIIAWAANNNLPEIRATQVSGEDSKRFWERNGFTKDPDPQNPCGDYVRRATSA